LAVPDFKDSTNQHTKKRQERREREREERDKERERENIVKVQC
jgi:hypothetical protein